MMKNFLFVRSIAVKLATVMLFFGWYSSTIQAQVRTPQALPEKFFGLTIDESTFNHEETRRQIIKELEIFKANAATGAPRPVVRIVLPMGCREDCVDENDDETNQISRKYLEIIEEIHTKELAYVMAEIMDSDSGFSRSCFLKEDGRPIKNPTDTPDKNLSRQCYLDRTKSFYSKLGENVDIWEIGNEINGDWFGGKQSNQRLRRKIVVSQVAAALEFFKDKPTKTAVTYYFNDADDRDHLKHEYKYPEDSMTKWIEKGGRDFPTVDYVLVSYYPDNNFYTPKGAEKEQPMDLSGEEWAHIFDLIRYRDKAKKIRNFPENVKFGIGEMGTHCQFGIENCSNKNSCERLPGVRECKRSEGCCPVSQVNIVRESYLTMDRQIRQSLDNQQNFVGGYFYWYYSSDVIEKEVFGSSEKKAQAKAVRDALLEAYRTWNRPATPNLALSLQSVKMTDPAAQVRILQEGDTTKPDPYTIVIVNNPAYRKGRRLSFDPINKLPDKFNESVDYIYTNLFGNSPNQAEKLLADDSLKSKIRVISVFIPNLPVDEENVLVGLKEEGFYLPEQGNFNDFFGKYNLRPDVAFAVTAVTKKLNASGLRTIEEEQCQGVKFKFDSLIGTHCYQSLQPGAIAIHESDRSMTALHEFGHAASSFPHGFVDDLYREKFLESSLTINKKSKGGQAVPREFAIYYLIRPDGSLPPIEEMTYKTDPPSIINSKSFYSSERLDHRVPSLMDDYRLTPNGVPEQCQFDKITRQFLLDRIRTKTQR